MGLVRTSPLACTRGKSYLFALSFDINGTSDPDGVDPTLSSDDLTVTRNAAGIFDITFKARTRPLKMLGGHAQCRDTDPNLRAVVSSYTASTGVMQVRVFLDDGTSGVAALSEIDNTKVDVWALFTKSSQPV